MISPAETKESRNEALSFVPAGLQICLANHPALKRWAIFSNLSHYPAAVPQLSPSTPFSAEMALRAARAERPTGAAHGRSHGNNAKKRDLGLFCRGAAA